MINPNLTEEELDELSEGLALIEALTQNGRGLDVASNAALKSIQIQAQRLGEMIRSLSDTNTFNFAEIRQRLKQSPPD